ncbi:MAG: DPP IV N-terminal domain-containing protein, partial [Bacteroidota bacterium]
MQPVSLWRLWIAAGLLMAMPATVPAQESVPAQEAELTLDDLFATPKLTGTTPSRPAWAPNSEHFAFSWSEPGQPGRGLWVSTSDGTDVRLRSTASASVRAIVWTDATTIVSLRGNHLWQTSLSQENDVQLMPVEAGARYLSVSPSGTEAAYVKNGDLWLADFASKQNRQLTEIGIPSLSSLPKGRYSRPEREIGPGIWSGPTYKWAPDGRTIALHVVDRREMRKVPFPDYLATETNPNEIRRGYPGDPNEIRRVGLLDVQSGDLTYLDLPDPDANQVIDFNWSPSGALLVDTASDTAVERKLFVVAPGERRLREIWRGVRESRMYTSFASTWHPDGENVVFLSDRMDRYGLYTIDATPSKDLPRLLTDPAYDVLSAPRVAGDALFYAGNGVNPYEQHVYRLRTSGGKPEQVTRLAGRNTGYPSPDGRHLAFHHSNDTSPTELYVMSSDGGDATRVTHSPLPAFTERTWAAAEYVSFPSLVD